jgi:hypothetical protein
MSAACGIGGIGHGADGEADGPDRLSAAASAQASKKPPLGVHIDHHHTTEDVVCRNQDPLAIRGGW